MEMEIKIERLIALPDSLILNILDRLGMKEACESAGLSLSCRGMETDERRKFAARVHALLAVRGDGPALQRFYFSFYYDDRFTYDVDSWLEFSTKNKVKNLSLSLKRDFRNTCSDRHTYNLSPIIYSNSSLTDLWLANCRVASTVTIGWRSLKKLSLVYVELPQQAVEEIVSGCPLLETLHLDGCNGFNRLEIGGLSFRSLKVKFTYGEDLLMISAPYMKDFQIEVFSCLSVRKVRLKDVPSLQSAYIDISSVEWHCSASAELMLNVMELFEDLAHVKKLSLSKGCTTVLSLMATNGWRLPQSKLEYLLMNAANDVHSIYGVTAILESCRYLKRLHLFSCVPGLELIEWGPTTADNLTQDLIHLKSVRIVFFDSKLSRKLQQMLLKRAPFMKKLVIK